jgi:hypothetical protein
MYKSTEILSATAKMLGMGFCATAARTLKEVFVFAAQDSAEDHSQRIPGVR